MVSGGQWGRLRALNQCRNTLEMVNGYLAYSRNLKPMHTHESWKPSPGHPWKQRTTIPYPTFSAIIENKWLGSEAIKPRMNGPMLMMCPQQTRKLVPGVNILYSTQTGYNQYFSLLIEIDTVQQNLLFRMPTYYVSLRSPAIETICFTIYM